MFQRPAKTACVPSAALGIVVASAVLASACAAPVRTPAELQGPGAAADADYPPKLIESAQHRAAAEAEWQQLFDAAGVAPSARPAPALVSFTHTPDATFAASPVRLAAAPGGEMTEERLRLLLRQFVARHAQLLGVAAPAVSLQGVTDAGPGQRRYRFVQSDYPAPIVAPYGELDLLVNAAGHLVGIADRAIPLLELPAEPKVTREAAAAGLVGATLTFGDKAGRTQTVTINDAAGVKVERLVVLPEATEQALYVRLAWEITAAAGPGGAGPAWTVYVDAITGERRPARQTFET